MITTPIIIQNIGAVFKTEMVTAALLTMNGDDLMATQMAANA